MVNNTIKGKEDIEFFEKKYKKIEYLIIFEQDIQKYIKYYDNFTGDDIIIFDLLLELIYYFK